MEEQNRLIQLVEDAYGERVAELRDARDERLWRLIRAGG